MKTYRHCFAAPLGSAIRRLGLKQDERSIVMASENPLSLYERLGGVYSIATVVDDLIDRIMVDSAP